jgi:hypothetical protein
MRISVISALCALAACGAVDPWAGRSPLETDPAGLRAAVALPEGVDVPAGGARLTIEASRRDLGETLGGEFALVRMSDGTRDVFRVADADVDEARALQARIRSWETTAPDETTGSITVSLAACRVGDGPAEDAVMTVWISPGPGLPLIPLARDMPIGDALDRGRSMGVCG